jgi:hypothetical protein
VDKKVERLLFFLLLFIILLVDVGVVKVAAKEGGQLFSKEGVQLFSNSHDNSTAIAHNAFRLQPLIEAFVVLIRTDCSMARTLHGEVNKIELVGVGDAFVRPIRIVGRQLGGSCGVNTGNIGKDTRDAAAIPLRRLAGGDFGLAGIVTFGGLGKEKGNKGCEYRVPNTWERAAIAVEKRQKLRYATIA